MPLGLLDMLSLCVQLAQRHEISQEMQKPKARASLFFESHMSLDPGQMASCKGLTGVAVKELKLSYHNGYI